jgi:hypothetical protein
MKLTKTAFVVVIALVMLVSIVSAQELQEVKRVGAEKTVILAAAQNPAFIDAYSLYVMDSYTELNLKDRKEVLDTVLNMNTVRGVYITPEKLNLLAYIFTNEPETSLKIKLILPLQNLRTEAAFLALAKEMRDGSPSLKRRIVPALGSYQKTSQEIIANSEKREYCLFKNVVYDIREPRVEEDKISFQFRASSNTDVDLYTYNDQNEAWLQTGSTVGIVDDPVFIDIDRAEANVTRGFLLKSGGSLVGSGGRNFTNLESAIPIPFIGPSVCPEAKRKGFGTLDLFFQTRPALEQSLIINVFGSLNSALKMFSTSIREDFSQYVSLSIGPSGCTNCDAEKGSEPLGDAREGVRITASNFDPEMEEDPYQTGAYTRTTVKINKKE